MASKLLGARVRRKEDPRLITGTSQYVSDIQLPGLQHVAFVRSPHAHARIRGIDATAARRRPGVVAVVTGRDLMAHCAPLPIATASAEGGAGEDTVTVGRQHHPLSVDRVRHVGYTVGSCELSGINIFDSVTILELVEVALGDIEVVVTDSTVVTESIH